MARIGRSLSWKVGRAIVGFLAIGMLLQESNVDGFRLLPPLRGEDPVPHSDLARHAEGMARMDRMAQQMRQWQPGGRIEAANWDADGSGLTFRTEGTTKRWDAATGKISQAEAAPPATATPNAGRGPRGRAAVGRAQQRTEEVSPDGRWKAIHRENNLWLEPAGQVEGRFPVAVTTDGTERRRYGTCCWVYGEELFQQDAIWWSPDSQTLAYYEVREEGMQDYYLTGGNLDSYTTILASRYPKAGDSNPEVFLWLYDLASGTQRKIDIPGEPRQYLYRIQFSPDGKELLVHRTNRRQDVLDWIAIDLGTLQQRIVVSEKQPTWQENAPTIRFLEDGQRFVWETESNGWKRFQLRHLDGRLLADLTPDVPYPCGELVRVDEATGWLYYTAFSDSNPYAAQLHRARLDGTQPQRITRSPLHHTGFQISPDHRHVVAVREMVDTPPSTVVYGIDQGEWVLSEGSAQAARQAGVVPAEWFSFVSADGTTTIHGILQKPAHFDPSRKYPLVIDVYGGPASQGLQCRYSVTNPLCELGVVVAKIGNRGTTGRGKAFESATYQRLGGVDLDDQAAGVRHLAAQPWVDAQRVGIFGHSYGGYMAALAVLRYPDLFHVAVAGAPVTNFKNYDTIYTERYMRTPQENPDGYRLGSCMEYASQLRGRLLLVHGLVDDNVHPSNTWQLSKALHDANKRFDMMIYPQFDHGIGGTYGRLRTEYLARHLEPTPVPMPPLEAGKREQPVSEATGK
jgi:dipeptidyl-peptidase-4